MDKEEYWSFGITYIFNYIYKSKWQSFEELNDIQIKAIKEYQPRTPAEHHPDEFPDVNGDNGTSFELYRGFFFKTEKEYSTFMTEIENGTLKLDNISSWTNHETVARKFANGASYYEHHQENVKGYRGVVLKTSNLSKESTLFSAIEAGDSLEEEFEDFLNLENIMNFITMEKKRLF